MEGQWCGVVESNSNARIILDVDDCGDHYRASAFVYIDPPGNDPNLLLRFRTRNKLATQAITAGVTTCLNGRELAATECAQLFPTASIPTSLQLDLAKAIDGQSLAVVWQAQAGNTEQATLMKSHAALDSDLVADRNVKTWRQFRDYVSSHPPRKFVFRGQTQPWRLRTSFHRTNRKDLVRFTNEDIPSLHRVLTPRMRHFFQLVDSIQNAAFWNLAQHHGYPTPLMDWTFSPFVASYFAFRPLPMENAKFDHVRIFMFDIEMWCDDVRQFGFTTMVPPHFSNLLALAIENERALPQQAISFVTNVDDVETYIAELSRTHGKNYLTVFDLPLTDRDDAMRELAQMGMTPGTLFPGLDGACEDMRLRNFGF